MAIVLHCPCGRKLQIKDEFAGQEGQCPACGRTLAIPRDGGDDAPQEWARPVAIARAEDAPPARPMEPSPRYQEDVAPEPDVRDIPNHGNGRIPDDADFFAPAPRAIGPLRSAWTTLRQSKQPWNPAARLILIGAVGLGVLLLGVGFVMLVEIDDDFWFFAIPIGVGALGALIAWATTRFNHTCTYVGREGAARFVCAGRRENLTTQEVFLFRDAVELRTSQTHYYNRGVYQSTKFLFTWYDVGGRKRHAIDGSHTSHNNPPPLTHYFQFARAAEMAWTDYLSEDVDRQLQLSGSVHFNLTKGKWIRLGQGFLILGFGEEPVECDARDIAAVQVQKGVVRIKRVDAEEGWFSSRGVYKFDFASLANAQLFFYVLDKVVGVPIG